MNNYPEWWNQTITVYNKFEHPETRIITWYKTVIPRCFWKNADNKLVVGETTIESNVTVCRIPKNDKFLEKYQWNELSANVRDNFFTFGVGDIIIRGEVHDTVNEYTKGQRSSDLLKKYKNLQGCMVIENCSINTGDGRGTEHYYVRGV